MSTKSVFDLGSAAPSGMTNLYSALINQSFGLPMSMASQGLESATATQTFASEGGAMKKEKHGTSMDVLVREEVSVEEEVEKVEGQLAYKMNKLFSYDRARAEGAEVLVWNVLRETLRELDIKPFMDAVVKDYLGSKERVVNGALYSTRWHWQGFPINELHAEIPTFVMQTAVNLKEALDEKGVGDEVQFGVLQLQKDRVPIQDPFLFVQVGGETNAPWRVVKRRLYLEVWEEPDFSEERVR